MHEKLAKLISFFIPQKELRKHVRHRLAGFKHSFPFSGRPKLGVSYNLFDGEELLEASIRSIRNNVDYINVIWQKVSNRGEPVDTEVEGLLKDLLNKGLIEEVFCYEPDLNEITYKNESAKRNKGLELARAAGCTHFMTMDTDEFYDHEEFKNAYKYILDNDITHSACRIISYYKNPEYRCLDREGFVSFIFKIQKHSSLLLGGHFNCKVDPTRVIPVRMFGDRFYFLQDIDMHHMTQIRKNLMKKYNNSSASILQGDDIIRKKKYDFVITLNDDNLAERNFVKVPNRFNVNIAD